MRYEMRYEGLIMGWMFIPNLLLFRHWMFFPAFYFFRWMFIPSLPPCFLQGENFVAASSVFRSISYCSIQEENFVFSSNLNPQLNSVPVFEPLPLPCQSCRAEPLSCPAKAFIAASV